VDRLGRVLLLMMGQLLLLGSVLLLVVVGYLSPEEFAILYLKVAQW
jgi:hypothetical protein